MWWIFVLLSNVSRDLSAQSPGQTAATYWRNIVARNMLCPFGHRVVRDFHQK